jgi:hypothetical protein
MNPIIGVYDNFFAVPEAQRSRVNMGTFEDVEHQDITYPLICKNLDPLTRAIFVGKLEDYLGAKVHSPTVFARKMPAGVRIPNWIHTDSAMGTHSAHVYLSPEWPAGTGTGFYTHATEGYRPSKFTNHREVQARSFDNWSRYLLVEGKYNRLLVHKADHFHCAEPVEGFGVGDQERLVLTCFFTLGG